MADGQEVKFKRGPSSTLPSQKDPGAFLIETDTGNMYLDDTAESRIQITDTSKLSKSGDSMTGPLNMSNNSITNVKSPENTQDAANKQYVDSAVQTVSDTVAGLDGTYLALSGGTMEGNISMGNFNISSSHTPSANTDLVNKQYVDSQFSGAGTGDFMASGAVPMTGDLQMGGHRIVNLDEPSQATDAATKSYVDTIQSDTKVTQTNTSTDANYRILLSNTATDEETTSSVYKNANFYFNPSTGVLTVTKIDTIIDDGVIS